MRYPSKSQYIRNMQCPKSLWLYRARPELRDAVAPEQQAIFDQGTAVGVLARQWLGGGVLVKADHTDPERALTETAVALASGIRVIYEAAFLHDGVLVRADIIARNIDGGWDLYEVKSTTKVEEEHLHDVAVQRYVLEGAGLKLDRVHLVHLDSSYVRFGALDLQKLFLPEDVTAETAPILAQVPHQVALMKAVADLPEAPKADIGPRCTKPHDCDFTGHCWARVPDYSVFNLAGARKDKTTRLWNSGVKHVADIPDYVKGDKSTDDYKLTDYQNVQRSVAKSGTPHIDARAIRAHLETLVYPLHYLDFEAVNPAVPPHDGTRPYMVVPTQASIHIQHEQGAPVEHFEFLGDGRADPRPDLVDFLRCRIDVRGSVIAYHKSYEGGILNGLAALDGRSGVALTGMAARLWDLAEPFKKAWYAHPRFLGKWSIKAVLPVLVPDMNYANLAIKNGAEAMTAYAEMMDQATAPERRAELAANLKAYCGYDTLAMVRILAHLETIAVMGTLK